MSVFSNTTIDQWFTLLSGYSLNMSLHTSDPLLVPANPASTEVTGGSYSRKSVTLTLVNHTLQNSAAVTFTGLPATTITHVGIWYGSGPNNGSFALAIPLTNSVSAVSGSSWTIPANQFVVSS